MPDRVTRRIIMQKARRQPLLRRAIGLRQLVSTRFQVLFHSPSGVLFTFRSRYYCTIGRPVVFSLGGWSPLIHTRFLVSGATREICGRLNLFGYGALTLCGRPSHAVDLRLGFVTPWIDCGRSCSSLDTGVATPASLTLRRFRLVPVRSPLLGESRFLSFPAVT